MSAGEHLIACGILEKEIRFLCEKNNWPHQLTFLPSSLHVDFHELRAALEQSLAQAQGAKRVAFYGECHPCMEQILCQANATRTPGQNCLDIYLGQELFTKELQQGAFFLFEDWARNWDNIIGQAISNDPQIVRSIFQSAHKYLLAIRTPCSGDFREAAEAISASTGLELRWTDMGLEHLERSLAETLLRNIENS